MVFILDTLESNNTVNDGNIALCTEVLSFCHQERFTQDMQPHYIYSPREMTRWVRGICEALRPLESLPVEGLVRIWAHEALRLFHDRFVTFPLTFSLEILKETLWRKAK